MGLFKVDFTVVDILNQVLMKTPKIKSAWLTYARNCPIARAREGSSQTRATRLQGLKSLSVVVTDVCS